MLRRRPVLVLLAGAAAVWAAGPLAVPGTAGAWAMSAARGAVQAGAVAAAGTFGRAIEVPGLPVLNKGGNAQVIELSCTSAGNCAAVGGYTDGRRHQQGFVVSELHGRWHSAIEVPGLGALNKGGNAGVNSVSCTSAGNCTAVGFYTNGSKKSQGFVAVERSGRWHAAVEVPGLGALNTGGNAGVWEVSCGSAVNCAAIGGYTDGRRHQQGFVVSEKNGRWGQAIEVPGLGILNKGGDASSFSVSCPSAGNCAAAGTYDDGSGGQGFVVSETNGVWGQAIEVPGLGALNQGGDAEVDSVSCGAAGNCVAVGDYIDGGANSQGFVVSEKNGVWGKAIDPPGLAALNNGSAGGNAEVDSVSCTSAGNCTAVGTYGEPYGVGFGVTEKNGVWERATDAVAEGGRFAGLGLVSCASPGNCGAGGFYSNDTGDTVRALVVAEVKGSWGNQVDVPGLGRLDDSAFVISVSCGSPGRCTAGGSFTDRHGHTQGYVT